MEDATPALYYGLRYNLVFTDQTSPPLIRRSPDVMHVPLHFNLDLEMCNKTKLR